MIIVTGELCSNGFLTNPSNNPNRSTNMNSYLPTGTTAGTPTGVTVIIGYLTNPNPNSNRSTTTSTNMISYLPRGTTAGTPTGDTVIIVIVEPIWVASADWVFVFTDPKVAWKSLLLLLFRLLLLFTITLLTLIASDLGEDKVK